MSKSVEQTKELLECQNCAKDKNFSQIVEWCDKLLCVDCYTTFIDASYENLKER